MLVAIYHRLYELVVFIRQMLKKYLYTINHRRLGLNYFYFSLITGMSGAVLATGIRLEMAYPGSPFFGGDSLRYLQVITAHALIMIFFVVVPIFLVALLIICYLLMLEVKMSLTHDLIV